MEKIVILDGYVANSGDLSWKALENLGEVTVYDRTAPGEVVERANDATAIYTNKVVITDEIMEASHIGRSRDRVRNKPDGVRCRFFRHPE